MVLTPHVWIYCYKFKMCLHFFDLPATFKYLKTFAISVNNSELPLFWCFHSKALSLPSDNEGASHICMTCHYWRPMLSGLWRHKPFFQQSQPLSCLSTKWNEYIICWCAIGCGYFLKHNNYSNKTLYSTPTKHLPTLLSFLAGLWVHDHIQVMARLWKSAACQQSAVWLFWIWCPMQCNVSNPSLSNTVFGPTECSVKRFSLHWCFFTGLHVLLGWAATAGMGMRVRPMGGLLAGLHSSPSPSAPSVSTPMPSPTNVMKLWRFFGENLSMRANLSDRMSYISRDSNDLLWLLWIIHW